MTLHRLTKPQYPPPPQSLVSADLHRVYSFTMALLSVSRLLSRGLGCSRWAPVVVLASSWSGALLCLASEGGVEWQVRNRMDVPTTAMATGIAACGIVILGYGVAGVGKGGGGGREEGGRGEDELDGEDRSLLEEVLEEAERGGIGEIKRGKGGIEMLRKR